jgi:hypothetical protein
MLVLAKDANQVCEEEQPAEVPAEVDGAIEELLQALQDRVSSSQAVPSEIDKPGLP